MGGKGSGGSRDNSGRPTPNTNRVKVGFTLDPDIRNRVEKIKIKNCSNFSDKLEIILLWFLKKFEGK
jgi:hypothetical protein